MKRVLIVARTARVGAAGALAAALLTLLAPPASADQATLYLDQPVASTPHPVLMAKVSPFTPDGEYQVSWHLEQGGFPVDGRTGTASGTMGATETYRTDPFPISAEGLPDGTYYVVGSITVDPGNGNPPKTDTFNESFRVDFTGPVVTSLTTSTSLIYPRISELLHVPGYSPTVQITRGAGSDPVAGYSIVKNGTQYASIWVQHTVETWYGRTGDIATPVVPEGTYTIVPHDQWNNPSSTTATITVSHKVLVKKMWTRTVTPQASMVDHYVGRCSTLRRPARKAWHGSVGYYSNTRCNTRSARKTSVSSLHTMRLPVETAYAAVRVDTNGGGAVGKRSSRAEVRYLGTNGDWLYDRVIPGRLTTHTGPTAGALDKFLFKNRVFAWGFATGYGNRYDVRSFTVNLAYYVLQ